MDKDYLDGIINLGGISKIVSMDFYKFLAKACKELGKTPAKLIRKMNEDITTLREASNSLIKVTNTELILHPGYPLIELKPKEMAEAGASIDETAYSIIEVFVWLKSRFGTKIKNPYASAIEDALPDKGLMLLNQDEKYATVYSSQLNSLTVAGIKFGGIEDVMANNDSGHIKVVPVSLVKFPLDNYSLASENELHRLGTITGGEGRCWTGKYYASHFLEGLFFKELYHDKTDMISIGNLSLNTSACLLPHTHYIKTSNAKKELESRLK